LLGDREGKLDDVALRVADDLVLGQSSLLGDRAEPTNRLRQLAMDGREGILVAIGAALGSGSRPDLAGLALCARQHLLGLAQEQLGLTRALGLGRRTVQPALAGGRADDDRR